jgi:putative peptidoglycan lipid II flippase
MKDKFSKSLAGTSVFIALFAFFSKGLGFFREILFASIYGLSTDFDIYLIGAALPLTINTIIIYLGQNYLIPSYNKIKEIDRYQAINFIQINFYFFIFASIILALSLYLSSGSIVSFFLHDSSHSLIIKASNIFNLFLITIPITGGISVIIAYQQSNFVFKYSVISQILPNIVVLITVSFYRSIDIYAIPLGFILGIIFQLIYLLINSKELLLNQARMIFSLKKFRKLGTITLFFIILIESIGQLYIISDRYFYSMVSTGGISALNYAQTVFALPLSIISIALSTAIFPQFSKLIHQKLFVELEKIFNKAIKINIVIFIPIMFLFILYGDTILSLIFERGKYSKSDTLITHQALIFYSISIVFYSAYSILNKIIYSAGLISKLLVITGIGITLKILLNYFLVIKLEQNGLALSTSITYIFFFMSSLFLVYKNFPFINKSFFLPETLLHILNCLISIIITKQISLFFPKSIFYSLIEITIFFMIIILNIILLKSSSANLIIQQIKNINFGYKF